MTRWLATSVGPAPVVEGTTVDATFGDDGRVAGSAGCNRYTAAYTRDGDRIAIGPAAATRMFCAAPAGVMDQEAAFLTALECAAELREGDGVISLHDEQGTELVAFSAVE